MKTPSISAASLEFETVTFRDLVGLPFEQQAMGPAAYDCYGLLVEMYQRAGKALPKMKTGVSVAENAVMIIDRMHIDEWKPVERQANVGVLFNLGRFACHIGFMLDKNRFIHAWRKTGVCVEPLSIWERRVNGFFDTAH